jgi:3-oxo-5-alpha-steroid 4-dehydrogenase 3
LENIKSIENKEIKSTKKNKSYSIPKGLLFQYVCCPHYLQEVCIYFSFVLLQPTSISMICLLLWVISNLSVSANNQFKWYKHHYNAKEYPKDWKKLIPFIW